MRGVLVGVLVLVFADSPAVVRADNLPEPFKPLAGVWQRQLAPDLFVIHELMFVAAPLGQELHLEVTRKLFPKREMESAYIVVGGRNLIGSTALGRDFTTHPVKIGKEKAKGVLILTVGPKEVPRYEKDTLTVGRKEMPLRYTLEKDTLTIVCKEPVAAGIRRPRYDISGTWVRAAK